MITIMTPTYNRAYILGNVYESLKKQTSFDFEWIIIDDGSCDNTESIVSSWQKECVNFEIIYFKQPNGGKHRAVNKGVSLAKYDWFFILDSDDSLKEYAVERIHTWISDVSGMENIAGVAGLKGTEKGAVGGIPKKKYIDATNLERKKYGLAGDKAEIYKTAVMKKYPFPEFEGENLLRESAVWDHIAKDGLKLRWYSEVIYICEYIEDGLTKNINAEKYANNFRGFTYCAKLHLETHRGFLYYHKCGEFYEVAKLKKISLKEAAKLLNVNCTVMVAGIMLVHLRRLYKRIF